MRENPNNAGMKALTDSILKDPSVYGKRHDRLKKRGQKLIGRGKEKRGQKKLQEAEDIRTMDHGIHNLLFPEDKVNTYIDLSEEDEEINRSK